MKRLEIKAYGTVRGGYVDHEVVGDTLKYSGEIVVKVLFSTRKIPFHGELTDASAFKSDQYKTPGAQRSVGHVTTRVLDEQGDIEILSPNYNLKGTVALDLSLESISVRGMRLRGEVSGVTLNVVAAPLDQLQHLV